MNRPHRVIALLFLSVLGLLAFSSCATTDEPDTATAPAADRSELPWNTPQSWEGMGPLGGFSEMMGTR